MARVRVDPIEHVLTLRGYLTDIDPSVPLTEMTQPYITVATATVADDTAYVQAVHGQLSRSMIDEAYAIMRDRYGVNRIVWRRQYPDGKVERIEKLTGAET